MLLLLQINALLQALSLLVRQSLPFERKLGQLLHPLRHVIVREQARPSDEAVRSGLGAGADGLLGRLDASVDLDVHVEAAIDDPLADLADLVGHGGDEFLSAEAGVDGHD